MTWSDLAEILLTALALGAGIKLALWFLSGERALFASRAKTYRFWANLIRNGHDPEEIWKHAAGIMGDDFGKDPGLDRDFVEKLIRKEFRAFGRICRAEGVEPPRDIGIDFARSRKRESK